MEDSHDKLKNETTEMLTIQAGDVISHSIKLDVSVRVFSPPPQSRTFPGSVNVRTIKPSAILGSNSFLVLKVQSRQETTQSGRILLDPKRARTLRYKTFMMAVDASAKPTPLQK